jgi:hypothetical protein
MMQQLQPQEPGTTLAKGLNFRTFLQTLERLRGRTAAQSTVEALTGEVHDAVHYGRIVASGWYPASWYRALHAAAHQVCQGGPELSRVIGRETTVADFQGIYKVVLAMFSPETVFNQTARLCRMYWQGGTAETVEVKKGIGRVRFKGWVDFDRNIWEDIIGSCEGVLLVCGASKVNPRVISGGFSSNLDVELRWT